jgi:hypothetical protein
VQSGVRKKPERPDFATESPKGDLATGSFALSGLPPRRQPHGAAAGADHSHLVLPHLKPRAVSPAALRANGLASGEPEQEITGEAHVGRCAKGFPGVFDGADVRNPGEGSRTPRLKPDISAESF